MRHAPLFAIVLLFAACATGQPDTRGVQAEQVRTRVETGGGQTLEIGMLREANVTAETIAATPSELWTPLVTVYADLGLTPNGADPRNRILMVGNQRIRRIANRPLSTFLDCGSGNAGQYANIYDVTIDLRTQLIEGPEGTSTVRTQFEASARDGGHGNAPIRCTSRRSLEQRIVEMLRERTSTTSP